MSGFVSKFRHVYGDAAKKLDCYTDCKNALTSGESQYVKANGKYWAYGKQSGGAPLVVKPLSAVGRQSNTDPVIATHKGRLTDFDFHPFIDNIVATCGDDCKININKFPRENFTDNISQAEVEIQAHRKKVSLITFNPSANSIIASAGFDKSVKVFNIETAAVVSSFDDFKDNVYSVGWNKDGSMLAATSKDKCLRLFDPRKPDEAIRVDSFTGMKASKCFFVNSFGWVGSTGFSKTAKREIKLWDIRNADKTILSFGLDNQASVLMPHVDDDLAMLYLCGKGDNSVMYYEFRNDDKLMHYLSAWRDGTPQKGGGWVFKRGLDVMRCEVQRFLKLTKDAVVPVSFIVPRKAGGDVFQEDIFPDCPSNKPALTADEWSAGSNADPCTQSMNPADRMDDDGSSQMGFTKKKTYDEVVQENTELQQRVKALEEEIAQLKAQYGVAPQDESKEEM